MDDEMLRCAQHNSRDTERSEYAQGEGQGIDLTCYNDSSNGGGYREQLWHESLKLIWRQ